MARLICTNRILFFFLFLQIYIIGEPVYCRMMGNSKFLETLKNVEKRASENCYDANNKHHIRLWNNRAPGAVGDDPCTDIPFLRVFSPKKSAPHTDVGIIIMPGGGYDKLTNVKEQTPVAQYFADTIGATAFILYYRLALKSGGGYAYPVPMWDAQRAVRYVRANAAKFNINPNHVGVFGFSAGGHLAATIALHSDQNFDLTKQDSLDTTNARPDFLGLGYPVISMDPNQYASPNSLKHLLHGYSGSKLTSLQTFLSAQKNVGPNTPPTFIFGSHDDKQISPQNSLLFIAALEKAGIPHEDHIFKHGKHGSGIAQDEPEERVWPDLFRKWLMKMKFIPKS